MTIGKVGITIEGIYKGGFADKAVRDIKKISTALAKFDSLRIKLPFDETDRSLRRATDGFRKIQNQALAASKRFTLVAEEVKKLRDSFLTLSEGLEQVDLVNLVRAFSGQFDKLKSELDKYSSSEDGIGISLLNPEGIDEQLDLVQRALDERLETINQSINRIQMGEGGPSIANLMQQQEALTRAQIVELRALEIVTSSLNAVEDKRNDTLMFSARVYDDMTASLANLAKKMDALVQYRDVRLAVASPDMHEQIREHADRALDALSLEAEAIQRVKDQMHEQMQLMRETPGMGRIPARVPTETIESIMARQMGPEVPARRELREINEAIALTEERIREQLATHAEVGPITASWMDMSEFVTANVEALTNQIAALTKEREEMLAHIGVDEKATTSAQRYAQALDMLKRKMNEIQVSIQPMPSPDEPSALVDDNWSRVVSISQDVQRLTTSMIDEPTLIERALGNKQDFQNRLAQLAQLQIDMEEIIATTEDVDDKKFFARQMATFTSSVRAGDEASLGLGAQYRISTSLQNLKKLELMNADVQQSFKRLAIVVKKFGRALAGVGGSIKKFMQGIGRMGRHLRNFGRNLQFTARDILFTIGSIGAFATVGIKGFSDLEEAAARYTLALATTSDVVRTFNDDLQANITHIIRTEAALRSYGVGIVDLANNMRELVEAGVTLADEQHVLETAFQLAKATYTETGDTIDTLTDLYVNFSDQLMSAGYGTVAEQFDHIADVLTLAVTRSKAQLTELRTAFQYTSGIAATYGVGIEEVAAALATLNKAGMPPSVSSRRLATALDTLVTKGSDYVDGIIDMEGKFVGLSEALTLVKDRYYSFGREIDRSRFLSEMFGAQQAEVISKLFQNEEAFNSLIYEMKTADGVTTEFAASIEDTLHKQLERLMVTLDNLRITVGRGISAQLEQVNVIDIFNDMIRESLPLVEALGVGLGRGIAKAGLIAADVVRRLISPITRLGEESKATFDIGTRLSSELSTFLRNLQIPYLMPLFDELAKRITNAGKTFDAYFGSVSIAGIEKFGESLGTVTIAALAVVPALAAMGIAVELAGTALSLTSPALTAVSTSATVVGRTVSASVGVFGGLVSVIIGTVQAAVWLGGVISAGGGLTASFSALIGLVGQAGAVLAAIVVVIDFLAGVIFGLGEGFSAVTDQASLFQQAIAGASALVSELVSTVLDILSGIFKLGEILGVVAGLFVGFTTDLAGFNTLLLIVAVPLAQLFGGLWLLGKAFEFVNPYLDKFRKWLLSDVAEGVKRLSNKIKKFFVDIINAIPKFVADVIKAAQKVVIGITLVSLGIALLPVIVAAAFANMILEMFGVRDDVINIFKFILAKAGELISGLVGFIAGVVDVLMMIGGAIVGAIAGVIKIAIVFIRAGLNGLLEFIGGVVGWIADVFSPLTDIIGGIFSGIVDTVKDLFVGLINFLIDGVNLLIDGINAAGGNLERLQHVGSSTSTMDERQLYDNREYRRGGRGSFAAGGIVPGVRGQSVNAILHPPEVVLNSGHMANIVWAIAQGQSVNNLGASGRAESVVINNTFVLHGVDRDTADVVSEAIVRKMRNTRAIG